MLDLSLYEEKEIGETLLGRMETERNNPGYYRPDKLSFKRRLISIIIK